MSRFKKWAMSLLCAGLVFILLGSVSVFAASFAPYYSYEYNDYDESVDAPIGYVPSATITGPSLGISNFNVINDMYYDGENAVYLLDSGNSRVVVVDREFQLQRVVELKDENGEAVQLSEAKGLTVAPDGSLYIADTKAYRVLITTPEGVVKQIITRPDEALQNTGASFDVEKVLLDKDGNIYVTARSINLGLMVFSPEGEFLRFWGANEVPTTMEAMMNYIRKKFLTDIQLESLALATPVVVENFDIDDDGFIYIVSAYRNEGTVAEPGLLRKLNYKGEDVLDPELIFGDVEWDRKPYPEAKRTWFNDVDVDDQGFVNLIDPTRGRVFQYTDSGQLISVFGALGNQTGCFLYPSAIETIGDKVYVSDSQKNVIYEFSPTLYGETVRSAVLKMNNYDMEGSIEEWQTILSKNTNSVYAYQGLGRVYDSMGDYEQAMKYYKLADAHDEYSKSFQQYRSQWLDSYFPVVLLVIAGIVALLILASVGMKKLSVVKEGEAYSRMQSKYAFPLYTLFHPTDGFSQFKFRKIQSMRLSAIIVFAWIVGMTLNFFYTGFSFNENRAMDYNVWINLMQTLGVFLLFVIANWAVSTLIDGKGTMSEIIATTSYALIPYIVSIYINLGLSNILCQTESVFIGMVSTIGLLWSALILICGMYSIHQYTFLKTLLALVLTVVGMLIIVFLLILFFGLLQQCWTFIVSFVKEAELRV